MWVGLLFGVANFFEIGSGDVCGAEGTEAGYLEVETLAAFSFAIGWGNHHAFVGQLNVEPFLLVLLADDSSYQALELSHDDFYFFANLKGARVHGYDVLLGERGNEELIHLVWGDDHGWVLVAVGVNGSAMVVIEREQGIEDADGMLILVTQCVEFVVVMLCSPCEEAGLVFRQVGQDKIGHHVLDSRFYASGCTHIDGVARLIDLNAKAFQQVVGFVGTAMVGTKDVPGVTFFSHIDVLYRHPILCIVAPSGDRTGGKPRIRSINRFYFGCCIHIGELFMWARSLAFRHKEDVEPSPSVPRIEALALPIAVEQTTSEPTPI